MSHESVTDEHILAGFKNLHEAITTGFDRMRTEMDERFAATHQRIGDLEHRMLRRFDEVDARFDAIEAKMDGHQRRISALETQP